MHIVTFNFVYIAYLHFQKLALSLLAWILNQPHVYAYVYACISTHLNKDKHNHTRAHILQEAQLNPFYRCTLSYV